MSQPSDEKKTQWIYARIHNDLASLETLLPDFDHVKTFAFEIYTCLCAAPYNDDVLPFFLKRWVLGQHEDDQKIITSAFINKNTIVLDYIRAHLDEILEFEKTLPDTQRHSNFQMIMESGEHWATKAMLPLLSDEQLCSAILSSHRFSSKPNRAYLDGSRKLRPSGRR